MKTISRINSEILTIMPTVRLSPVRIIHYARAVQTDFYCTEKIIKKKITIYCGHCVYDD